jgi:hypothetical protein
MKSNKRGTCDAVIGICLILFISLLAIVITQATNRYMQYEVDCPNCHKRIFVNIEKDKLQYNNIYYILKHDGTVCCVCNARIHPILEK